MAAKKLTERHLSTEATARGVMLSTGAAKPKPRRAKAPWREVVSPPARDYYLDFIRAEEALKGVAERDHAVQDVLRTIRARVDQQLGEVEEFTRDWTERVRLLKNGLEASQELVATLARACKTLKDAPGGR